MGNFFDKDIDFYGHSLLNKDQKDVSSAFKNYLITQLEGDPFERAGEIFDKFFEPALENFDTNVLPAIRGSFANNSASQSSRRPKLEAEQLTRVQLGAQQQFGALLPAFLGRETQLASIAGQFATRPTVQTTGVAQPGLGEQISSGIELGGQVYGAIFGGGITGV